MDSIVKMYPDMEAAYQYLQNSPEVNALLEEANKIAMGRLRYNDHGPVHSHIVARNALIIHELLEEAGIEHTMISEGCSRFMSRLVTFTGAYLHDVGNGVHRELHYVWSPIITRDVLKDMANHLGMNTSERTMFVARVMEVMYTHDESVKCLSTEGGCVTVADGTDMAEGRARAPYEVGKMDIHSISALAISKVHLDRGREKPISITVEMNSRAGIFQVQNVLGEKIRSSGLMDLIEIYYRHNPSKTEGRILLE